MLTLAVLVAVYLIGFAVTMNLTNRDFDLALGWPLIAPFLVVRAIFVGIKYIIKEW